jgi:MFS family permease
VFLTYLAASAASTALFVHSGKAVEAHSPKSVFFESLLARVGLMLLFVWGPVYVLFGRGSPSLFAYLSILNALMGVTWAFISTASTLFLVRLVGRTSRGRALGLYNAVAGAGGLLGTLLGGWLFVSFGVDFAYSIASLTVIAGAMLLLPIPYHMFVLPRPSARSLRRLRSVRALAPAFGTSRPLRGFEEPGPRSAAAGGPEEAGLARPTDMSGRPEG